MALHTRPQPSPVSWEQVRIPAPGGPVPGLVLRPERPRAGRWLVWAHGGSWRAGSALEWYPATSDLARAAGMTVVSVDYRLTPAARHPDMVQDLLAALTWAAPQAERELAEAGSGAAGAAGGGPVLAVGGDSAGGTLAASAAVACRDRGVPLAAQVLAYPPLDPACEADSYRRYAGAFPSASAMAAAWGEYRAAGRPTAVDGTRLYSTPFEAAELGGVAPAILAVGELDPVGDDVRRYAGLLRAADVPVTLREFARTGHGAFLRPGGSGASAAELIGAALRAFVDAR
ncbi:alpha/beta hydrolase [Streptomyces sp. NPDC056503]|uniref:alpha/beta hydrolase n=1 Tax=Streptomyces sp. NPDC056503 TaxID=3345842 RepID=UPI0036AFFD1E